MYLLKHISSRDNYGYFENLHSTMYLLKHACSFNLLLHRRWFTFHYVSIKTKSLFYQVACHIYLHSTMYLLKLYGYNHSQAFEVHLHSTMYLLKLELPANYPESPSFTFHYVSIKTFLSIFVKAKPSIFTFHYVSIKTLWDNVSFPFVDNLHSTMYLLKLPQLIAFRTI